MSEQTQINDNVVLIGGESATGKSASLRNIDNERVLYVNCEAGKKLPFKAKCQQVVLTDPRDIFDLIEEVNESDDIDVVVIDTLTFLMDMYEMQYVLNSDNTMRAWGTYATFFKELMFEYVANSPKAFIFLAHTRSVLDEEKGEYRTSVPIKGALGNQGIEAYFTSVLATKKVDLKELKDFENKYLDITPDDEALGFKYVFQTKLTRKTRGERIRSPLGMWDTNETYIDNDLAHVIERIMEYYAHD